MANNAINVGDYIVYSIKGICKVAAIETKKFDRDDKDYFVLAPVFDSKSTYFVPVDYDSERVHIKPALNEKAANELIDYAMNATAAEWIINPNERKQVYDKIYKGGTRQEVITIIKALKAHEQQQKEFGKQLYTTDERMLKGCINLICGELAYVLNLTIDEITEKLGY